MNEIFNANPINLNHLFSLGSLPFSLNQNLPLLNTEISSVLKNLSNTISYHNAIEKQEKRENNKGGDSEIESSSKNSRMSSSNNRSEKALSRIFVSYPRDATEYELNAAFKKFGKILDIYVVKDKLTKKEKGIAYIKFSKSSEAIAAYDEMYGKNLNNNYSNVWPLKIYICPSSSGPNEETLRRLDFYTRMHRIFIVFDKSWNRKNVLDEFKVKKTTTQLNNFPLLSSPKSNCLSSIIYLVKRDIYYLRIYQSGRSFVQFDIDS
jgi:RNA recognition motif-containing protein